MAPIPKIVLQDRIDGDLLERIRRHKNRRLGGRGLLKHRLARQVPGVVAREALYGLKEMLYRSLIAAYPERNTT